MKQVIIITGGGSGFGSEFALQYDKKNTVDEIWLFGRRLEKLTETANSMRKTITKIYSVDISQTDGINSIKNILKREYDSDPFNINILVNNAGMGRYGEFKKMDLHSQLQIIDTNVSALTSITYECLDYMSRGSKIVNMSSLAAYNPVPRYAIYAATKSYVFSFSIALNAELESTGIKVFAICPGQTHTDFPKVAIDDVNANFKKAKNPAEVVRHAINQIDNNKCIIIYGVMWKLKALFSHFLNKEFMARFIFNHIIRIKHK